MLKEINVIKTQLSQEKIDIPSDSDHDEDELEKL